MQSGARLRWLGTDQLTWRDLRVFVSNLPTTSALYRSRFGEKSRWGESEHLLAAIYDLLNVANYQRIVASGKKGAKKPRPIPRPGANDREKFGRGAIPLSKFSNWWQSKKQSKG